MRIKCNTQIHIYFFQIIIIVALSNQNYQSFFYGKTVSLVGLYLASLHQLLINDVNLVLVNLKL